MACREAVWLILLTSVFGLTACRRERETQPAADPWAQDWVVDPAVPGPDLPPTGHSLFDALVPDPVPFPFSRLLDTIESKVSPGAAPRRVLIPLGRSLQRSAGAPRFFRYPRAVAVFGNDRLFLGYHEKAGVIEVISYNAEAGRFEFQLVQNYREGSAPRVFYGRRAICTTCHQNHGPLFPTQLWDETNSNYRVYRLLVAEKRDFYGFPIQQSADVPYQIDLAVHQANEFSVYQRLWEACDAKTRAAWLAAMLRCRLTGNCRSPELEPSLGRVWAERWPRGLRIPNPEIPNRNPLAILSREGPSDEASAVAFLAEFQKKIDQQFEPTVRRAPLDIWKGDPSHVERVVAGLAGFFTREEIRDLDRALSGFTVEMTELHARCAVEREAPARMLLQCEPAGERGFSMVGRLRVRGASLSGSIASLDAADSGSVRDLEVVSGGMRASIVLKNAATGLSARCGDGNQIRRIRFEGTGAILECRRDFGRLRDAVERLLGGEALASKSFRASAVLRELSVSLKAPGTARRGMPVPARKPLLEPN